jgi:transcriptional regulator with XRE-family HTH domain
VPALPVLIGRIIAAERTRRGWRQEDLAEQIGMSRAAVGHIETGRHPIGVDHLPAVCRALDISIGALFVGADPDDLTALRGPA